MNTWNDSLLNAPVILPLMALMVFVWLSNRVLTVPDGSMVYQSTHASVSPKKRYIKKLRALPCSFRSIFSERSCMSFSSSCFMVLYMSGTAARAARKTNIMLA